MTEFQDFAERNTSGMFLGDRSLLGAGVHAQVYRMTPRTSTHAAAAAALVKPQPNPLRLMRAGSTNPAVVPTGIELAGFALQGTDQGGDYGGLMVCYSRNASIHDLHVSGIPGSAPGPPGETFSMQVWHADGARLSRVTVDGRNGAGVPCAATLFGVHSSADVVLRDCAGNHAAWGFGIAVWLSADVTCVDCDLSDNLQPINIEQPTGGTMRFTRCDLRGADPSRPMITCNGNITSVPLIIEDPVVDRWPITVGVSSRPYMGKPQRQRVGDVHLIVDGVDVSADPRRLRAGGVW